MPARNLVILILSAIVSLLCHGAASKHHYGSLLAGAIKDINDSFVRPVQDRDLFEGAMEGMVRQLDPHSDYISPDELEGFQEDLNQKFGGIGIVVEVNPTTNRLTVLSPLPDTPAFAAGMRAGDQILVIDGKSTEGFQIADAVDLMRGAPGTRLTITIQHAGASETVDLTLMRAIIPVASVLGDVRNPDGSWQFALAERPDVGYVRLVSFGEQTAAELRSVLSDLQSTTDGLILDLRGNGGGLLEAAVDVCDLFIDRGTIVSIRGRDQRNWRDYSATESATRFRDLPIVVLVDGYSASASEITAACLQDHDRAIVVGTRTWGKGTVQNVLPFEGGRSALKLTVATYWRPSGNNIHRHVDAKEDEPWGVTPDQGYVVETDDKTLAKIVLLRRERDKVQLDSLPQEEVHTVPVDPTDPVRHQPQGTDLLDITGFEDPQLKRAIEAVEQLIEARPSRTRNH